MAATAFEMLQLGKGPLGDGETVPIAFHRHAVGKGVERFAIQAAQRLAHFSGDWSRVKRERGPRARQASCAMDSPGRNAMARAEIGDLLRGRADKTTLPMKVTRGQVRQRKTKRDRGRAQIATQPAIAAQGYSERQRSRPIIRKRNRLAGARIKGNDGQLMSQRGQGRSFAPPGLVDLFRF